LFDRPTSPDLIDGLTDFLAADRSNAVSRAVLAHLEFVTIHPFLDGNGRIARLLMNYVLLVAGYPWVTIRSDERVPYFTALEHAQVDEDATELGHFLGHHIAQATVDATKAATTGRRR
jgi:Fic family protein